VAYAQVNGVELYYEEHGSAASPALVLMHGGSGSLDDAESGWARLIPALAEEHHVYAVEHRGHGHTGNPLNELRYEQIADDLSEFIRALGTGPVHFGGVSDGGIVALHLATASPELLRSMVCVGTNYRVDDTVRQFLAYFATPEAIEANDPAWAASLARRHDPYHGQGYWRTLMRQIAATASTSPAFTEEQLAAITTPSLFVAGERDPFANTEQMVAFKKHVPGAEWLIVNDAWHTVQHSHAEIVGPRVVDFYRRQR
jgi:pimeloyl-ACP methyl ester carboxylesterase